MPTHPTPHPLQPSLTGAMKMRQVLNKRDNYLARMWDESIWRNSLVFPQALGTTGSSVTTSRNLVITNPTAKLLTFREQAFALHFQHFTKSLPSQYAHTNAEVNFNLNNGAPSARVHCNLYIKHLRCELFLAYTQSASWLHNKSVGLQSTKKWKPFSWEGRCRHGQWALVWLMPSVRTAYKWPFCQHCLVFMVTIWRQCKTLRCLHNIRGLCYGQFYSVIHDSLLEIHNTKKIVHSLNVAINITLN